MRYIGHSKAISEGEFEMSKSGFAAGHLRSFIERVEQLESEKAELTADIREVYYEAKGHGFDTKIMRRVVALRKLDTADRQEQEAVLDLYLTALGMEGTPLGDYAKSVTMKAGSKTEVQHDPETGEITEERPEDNHRKIAKTISTKRARKLDNPPPVMNVSKSGDDFDIASDIPDFLRRSYSDDSEPLQV